MAVHVNALIDTKHADLVQQLIALRTEWTRIADSVALIAKNAIPSNASATITSTASEADSLADLKARLSSLQTQSMSNVISTDRQVLEVGA